MMNAVLALTVYRVFFIQFPKTFTVLCFVLVTLRKKKNTPIHVVSINF